MASIVDSFREVFTDRLSFLKLVVLAVPVYYSYQVYMESDKDFTGFFWLAGITLFLLFGFLIEVTNNLVNERNTILPSLNPFTISLSSIKGILAIGPSALISCFLANYVCSFINIIPWLDITFKSIIWLVVASIIVTSFLMFSTRKRVLDAYNLKVLSQKSGDLIITIIFFLIQLTVINLPTSAFLGYTLFILFGDGPIFNFFLALVLVFNIAVTGHYLAQVHYEVLTYNKID
jgi:hypothetical protein